jgi:hypothetical protein
LGAFDAGDSLLFGFDGVAALANSLNGVSVEHWCAWDALGCKADYVIHLLDPLGASFVAQATCLVASHDLIPDALRDA